MIVFVACTNAGERTKQADTDTVQSPGEDVSDTSVAIKDALSGQDTLTLSGNPVIDSIRMEYQRIQQNPALRKLEVNYSGAPGSEAKAIGVAGKMTYFFDGDELVKAWDAGQESHGKWNEEFFFKDGELFFIYVNGASGGALEPDAFPYQSRLYLHEGKIYREISSGGREMDDREKEALLKKGKALYTIRTEAEIRKFY